MKEKIKKFFECCRDSSWQVRLSAVVMGGGQMCYGRPVKGIMLFLAQVSILIYFITRGWRDIQGFFTLGTTKGDAWLGIEGDNSVVMLLMGIFAWIILAVFIALYRVNLKDV